MSYLMECREWSNDKKKDKKEELPKQGLPPQELSGIALLCLKFLMESPILKQYMNIFTLI